MTTPYLITRDQSGAVGYGLKPTDKKYSATIASATDTTLTLPSDSPYYEVVFSYSDGYDVWVAYGATAAVPAGATFAATTSELNPTVRRLSAGTVIHFICASALDIGVTAYAMDNAS